MRRIFFVGYMGAGKTTLGRALSKKVGLSFIDLDWFIEERFHKSIRELYFERGGDGFRRLEMQMLHEVGEFEDVIISTGGGTPCFFDNMEYINTRGETVYLDVHPDVLFRRLRIAKQQRPLICEKSDAELMQFILEALEERKECYTKAKYIFNADELEDYSQIKSAVERIRRILKI